MHTKEKIKINVTQRDIKLGKVRDCYFCPIARAIKRTKWGKKYGDIGVMYVTIKDKLGNTIAELPPEARNFISKFDTYLPVKPFSFQLEILVP